MEVPSILLRPIRVEDNPVIATIIRTVLTEFGANRPGTVFYDPTTDALFELFMTPHSAYFIAEVDGCIAGGCGIFPTNGLPLGCCELVKLYLLPQYRGIGLGRKLIMACIERAASQGFTSIYLETMPELNQAKSLYEKCGFKYLEQAMGNSGHFGCDLWMLKQISPENQ